MASPAKIQILGGCAAAANAVCVVFSIILAVTLRAIPAFSAVHVLLYVTFAFIVLATVGITLLSTIFIRYLQSRRRYSRKHVWHVFASGLVTAFAALALSGTCLIWTISKRNELPSKVIHHSPMVLVGVWFGLWSLSIILQILLFSTLVLWIKSELAARPASRLDLDFGFRIPEMDENRSESRRTNQSFHSQDITLATPPRTPTSPHDSSTRRSSITRVGPGSFRAKFVKSSAKSSLEIPPFPAADNMSIDSAFDQWDTSSVHREMRAAVHSSPPVTRAGLETIPGSRSESPADALDEPFLPSSPHATSSETATAVGWTPSSPTSKIPTSSPPSSPPNFSRPTSSSFNKPPMLGFDSSMQDLIHPLFRPNSPHPPPIAVAGTMVTASPMAEHLMTPKTLARLRSNSQSQLWKAMPTIDKSDRPGTAGSIPGRPRSQSSSTPGSPGPSIIEDDLPPILPGFVLSAGSRSSLVGYGKRKSVKSRPQSQLSIGSRLSQLLT